jgi:hypothetical protein
MRRLSFEDAGRVIRVESGQIRQDRLTLFSVMKNEMAFLPGWLAHHRGIGFEQFLVWDDASSDGTDRYLRDQPDCVVLRSDSGFGEPVRYAQPNGMVRKDRFGTYVKGAAPQHFLGGQFVAYLDADEFLILPPGVSSVGAVVDRLRAEGAPSCLATLIEFFPAASADLAGRMPDSFDGLIAAYPYIQAETIIEPVPRKAAPRSIGQSKTARLYARYGIELPLVRRGWHRIWMPERAKRGQRNQTSPRYKTPLILRDGDSFQVGSHNGSRPPSMTTMLSIAHFVFTARSREKIRDAIRWGAHTLGGRKYHGYAALLDAMEGRADGFLDAESVRYEGPEQLVALGLMRWQD